jgi:diguanylate cyclase (GGDEF)-like protein
MAGVLVLFAASPTPAASSIEELQALRDSDPAGLLARLEKQLDAIPADADPRFVAEQYRQRAELLRERGEYARARQDADAFQRRAEALADPLLRSASLMLHGTIDAEQSNIAEALERFHEARRLLEASNETRELSRVNNAIGVAHNFTLDFARARHYYAEALRLARLAGDATLEGNALGNLALTVSEIDGPEAGLLLHQEAMALAQKRGDPHGQALQLANICQRLLHAERLEEARSTCNLAIEKLTALQLMRPLAGVRMTLGDLARKQGELREAIGHYEAALQQAKGVVPMVELTLRNSLSEVHDALGEPDQALRQLQAKVTLEEELQARERQSQIEELEVRYKVEQRERQLQVMTLDAELQQARLEQRTLMLLAAAVALALASLGALLAWRGYRIEVRLERKLAARNQALEQALAEISVLARTDSLTGLWNRRAFEELTAREIARAKRNHQPLTIALADIDSFKAINDRLGHEAGDTVIKMVAEQLRSTLRKVDLVCRWGGEEFLCLLPDSDIEAARRAMQRIRSQLALHPVDIGDETITITLTFGIAALEDDLAAAVRRADAAMYEGKRSGRDLIMVASEVNAPEPDAAP